MRNFVAAFAVATAFVITGMAIDEDSRIAHDFLERASTPAVKVFPVAKLQEPIIIAQDSSATNREAVLRILFETITKGGTSDDDKVKRVATWVQSYFVHPMYTPLRPSGQGVYDPMQLLSVRRAQCGQVNRVMLDILATGGYRGRVVQLKAHQGAEVFFNGRWHYIEADALTGGDQITDTKGRLPSAVEIYEHPHLLDGKCLGCEATMLNEPLSPEHKRRFGEASQIYRGGDAWREVFSVRPIYYEKFGGKSDPEYGWMTYRTTTE